MEISTIYKTYDWFCIVEAFIQIFSPPPIRACLVRRIPTMTNDHRWSFVHGSRHQAGWRRSHELWSYCRSQPCLTVRIKVPDFVSPDAGSWKMARVCWTRIKHGTIPPPSLFHFLVLNEFSNAWNFHFNLIKRSVRSRIKKKGKEY